MQSSRITIAFLATAAVVAISCSDQDGGLIHVDDSAALSEALIIDDDCPPCGERRPTPDEFNDIQRQIDKMDSCGSVQSILESHLSRDLYIFTDPAAQDTMGGAFVMYSDGSTEIYISADWWDLSGNQFEAELFNVLKHEAVHGALWEDETHDWGTSDYHDDSFWSQFDTCHAS